MAFGTGMRPSELMALKWSAVDEVRGTVSVREARIVGQDKSTKTHETRTLPLMPLARQAVEDRRRATDAEALPYVFANPLTREALHDEQPARKVWNRTLSEIGVRHRKAYATRHTFATLLLMAGEPIERISAWLGHKNPSMTYGHYARWVDATAAPVSAAALAALG